MATSKIAQYGLGCSTDWTLAFCTDVVVQAIARFGQRKRKKYESAWNRPSKLPLHLFIALQALCRVWKSSISCHPSRIGSGAGAFESTAVSRLSRRLSYRRRRRRLSPKYCNDFSMLSASVSRPTMTTSQLVGSRVKVDWKVRQGYCY